MNLLRKSQSTASRKTRHSQVPDKAAASEPSPAIATSAPKQQVVYMTPDVLESLRRDRSGSHNEALSTSQDNDSDSDSDDGVRANVSQTLPAIPRTPSQSGRTPPVQAPVIQRTPTMTSQIVAPVPPMLPAQGDEVRSPSFSQRPMSMITTTESVPRSPSIRSATREAEDAAMRARGAGSLVGRPDPVRLLSLV